MYEPSEHVHGSNLHVRMYYPEKGDDYKIGTAIRVNSVLEEMHLSNLDKAGVNSLGDGRFVVQINTIDLARPFDLAYMIRFVKSVAHNTDCEEVDIDITSNVDVLALQGRWRDHLLNMWEVDPVLFKDIPFETGAIKVMDMIFRNAWNGRVPIVNHSVCIIPGDVTRKLRAGNVADTINTKLVELRCKEIPKDTLITTLMPLIQPVWDETCGESK